MAVENYFDSSALSQSKLKLLLSDPRLFHSVKEPSLYYEEKKHFIIGSGVDCIITEGQETFEEKYHVSQLENKPSDTVKSIVNLVFDRIIDLKLSKIGCISIYKQEVLSACNEHEYQARWRDELRVNKICESYEYWEDLKAAYGKQVISAEEYATISRIVMSLKTSEATAPYFIAEKREKVDVFYQLPIYFTYEGEACKALLDMVIVDHLEKVIVPIDIKTMGEKSFYFPKALRKRRYDIQAAFYTEALPKWMAEKGWQSYKIASFKFMVESTVDEGVPLIYTLHKSLLHIGKYGRPLIGLQGGVFSPPEKEGEEGKVVPVEYGKIKPMLGFHQLINLYKYYVEKGFDQEIRVRENKSELLIDWDGIIG